MILLLWKINHIKQILHYNGFLLRIKQGDDLNLLATPPHNHNQVIYDRLIPNQQLTHDLSNECHSPVK